MNPLYESRNQMLKLSVLRRIRITISLLSFNCTRNWPNGTDKKSTGCLTLNTSGLCIVSHSKSHLSLAGTSKSSLYGESSQTSNPVWKKQDARLTFWYIRRCWDTFYPLFEKQASLCQAIGVQDVVYPNVPNITIAPVSLRCKTNKRICKTKEGRKWLKLLFVVFPYAKWSRWSRNSLTFLIFILRLKRRVEISWTFPC